MNINYIEVTSSDDGEKFLLPKMGLGVTVTKGVTGIFNTAGNGVTYHVTETYDEVKEMLLGE